MPAPLPILAVVLLTSLLAMIDQTIVNVAYDQIAASLGAGINEISWVSTAYLLAGIIISPLNGWLTALVGRKRFFIIAVAVFGAGSLLCGLAGNAMELGTCRFLQGLGGGLIGTVGFSILVDNCADDRRGEALALISISGAAGPVLGSVLGGYLLENYSWPIIFLINIPFVIGALILANSLDLDQSKKSLAGRVSYFDLACMFSALFALQYVVQEGQISDWFNSGDIVLAGLVFCVAGGTFVYRQLHARQPMVELRLFCDRPFLIGNVINIAVGMSILGVSFILPLFLQQVAGYTPLQVGQFNIPAAITTLFGITLYRRLYRALPPYVFITTGLLGFAVSLAITRHYDDSISQPVAILIRAGQGFSTGLFTAPLLVYAMRSIPNVKIDQASGLFNLVRQVSGMLTVGVLGSLLERSNTYYTRETMSRIQSFPKIHGLPITAKAIAYIQNRATVLSYEALFDVVGICLLTSAVITVSFGVYGSIAARRVKIPSVASDI